MAFSRVHCLIFRPPNFVKILYFTVARLYRCGGRVRMPHNYPSHHCNTRLEIRLESTHTFHFNVEHQINNKTKKKLKTENLEIVVHFV